MKSWNSGISGIFQKSKTDFRKKYMKKTLDTGLTVIWQSMYTQSVVYFGFAKTGNPDFFRKRYPKSRKIWNFRNFCFPATGVGANVQLVMVSRKEWKDQFLFTDHGRRGCRIFLFRITWNMLNYPELMSIANSIRRIRWRNNYNRFLIKK